MLTRAPLRCVASCNNKSSSSKADNPIVQARKRFEVARQTAVKDTFNKLSAIAAADVKQVTDFLVELDTLHKKELQMQKPVEVEPETIFESTDEVSKTQ